MTSRSLLQIIISQYCEHKAALVSTWIVSIFLSVALLAPIYSNFSGLHPSSQNVYQRYAPSASRVELAVDEKEVRIEKLLSSKPEMLSLLKSQLSQGQLIAENASEDQVFDFLVRATPETIIKLRSLNTMEMKQLADLASQFSNFHLLGTDELGRDFLTRLIYGARISMGVGICVAIISALIGLLIGILAGYYGGVLDAFLMRMTDSLLALPTVPLLIVLAAVDLKKIPWWQTVFSGTNESMVKLIVILCLFSWMRAARLVRASTLSVREREFVAAAKTLGVSHFSIMTRHLIPNIVAPLLVEVSLTVGNSILWEASLSFLGLGIQPPTPSWGNMLFNAMEVIYQRPILIIVPGLLIWLTVLSFNFIGDGLQDAIDPKAIRR